MAVELTATDYSGVGTGAPATYATGIYANASNQIKVYVAGVLQTIGVDYSLAGIGSKTGVDVIGSFAAAAAVYIERVTPTTQEVDTKNNETILEDVLDGALDKLTLIAQELDSKSDRALLVPRGETAPTLVSFTGAVNDMVLGWLDGTLALLPPPAPEAAAARDAAVAAKNQAEAARDATLAAFDQFDDRYLGAKTSDPTLDNDGNALAAGMLYFNSVVGEMRVYTGTAWVAAYVSGTDFVSKTGDTMTGKLTAVTSATGAAGFRLPHGATPTTLADGDVWTTTAGLFARVNGATQQLAPLASPAFTGTPSAPTPAAQTNGTSLATTAFVQAELMPSVQSLATGSSVTPNGNPAGDDMIVITALAANLTINAHSGTPVQGKVLIFRIKDNGTIRTLAWNAIYRAIGVTLPTATVANKTFYIGFIWNATDSVWDCVLVRQQA